MFSSVVLYIMNVIISFMVRTPKWSVWLCIYKYVVCVVRRVHYSILCPSCYFLIVLESQILAIHMGLAPIDSAFKRTFYI